MHRKRYSYYKRVRGGCGRGLPWRRERERLGLSREEYRVYSGRGGRRADRLTTVGCLWALFGAVMGIFAIAGWRVFFCSAISAADLAVSALCIITANRLRLARYARCARYSY